MGTPEIVKRSFPPWEMTVSDAQINLRISGVFRTQMKGEQTIHQQLSVFIKRLYIQ